MKRIVFILPLLLALIIGCSSEELDSSLITNTKTNDLKAKGPIIHHASVGSYDYCDQFGEKPGCDANFSLVANMYEDGSVSGHFTDVWAGGVDGVKVNIDCMLLYENIAVIGGTIMSGGYNGEDLTGLYAFTAVADNGTSANDTPDQISLAWIFPEVNNCEDLQTTIDIFGLPPLLDIKGQVKVW